MTANRVVVNQKMKLLSIRKEQWKSLCQVGKWVQKSLQVGARSSLFAILLLLLTLFPPLTQSCESSRKLCSDEKRFYSKIDEVNFLPLSEKCPVICGLLVF